MTFPIFYVNCITNDVSISVKITISLKKDIKHSLAALVRKNKKSVSGMISEWVKKERIRQNITSSPSSLGSKLRTHKNILPIRKDYKEQLGKLREEKHLK